MSRYRKFKKNRKISSKEDMGVASRTPRYSSIADLRGAAGTLRYRLTWHKAVAIAYEDRIICRTPRKRQ